MKTGIHPKYYPNAKVVCSCGNTWTTGSTRELIHTDMCAKCHPFYTGEQRMVDTEGQVDRFYKKLEIRDQFRAAAAARDVAKSSPDQPITSLELGARAEAILANAGLHSVSAVLERFEQQGEDSFLTLEGFGRKSLIDLKKRLRARGLLPEAGEAEPASAEPAAE
ncbi:MAG: 50S ribosomal protein L31 [Anaerolineales bacterium]|nr:50S ribosomal protein L31 [Anaerolineales bacterium]